MYQPLHINHQYHIHKDLSKLKLTTNIKNLLEENIKLNFHRSFCVPEDEIKNLIEVADNATPLKFIKGNGEYIGVFVIQEISKTLEQASPEGDLLSIQVDIRLREYTGKIPDDEEEEKGFKKK